LLEEEDRIKEAPSASRKGKGMSSFFLLAKNGKKRGRRELSLAFDKERMVERTDQEEEKERKGKKLALGGEERRDIHSSFFLTREKEVETGEIAEKKRRGFPVRRT